MPAGSGGGGGIRATTCYLTNSANLDIHLAGIHTVTYNHAADNPLDNDALGAVPAGLGLSIDLTGASPTITVTQTGVWVYEAQATLVTGTDANLKASLGMQLTLVSAPFGPIAAGAEVLQTGVSVAGHFASAFVNDAFNLRVVTDNAAAANPYNVNVGLWLARVG